MKIAVVYCGTVKSSWNDSDGIVRTLQQMGHQVTDVPIWRQGAPPVAVNDLTHCDLVLGSGLEHLAQDAAVLKVWQEIKAPKFALYHESFFRDDVTFDFHALKGLADEHFFPAAQDARMFNGANFGMQNHCHWLPFGVDITMFDKATCPKCLGKSNPFEIKLCPECRGEGVVDTEPDVTLGFIGTNYHKRASWVNGLSHHLKGIPMIGTVVVQDIDGFHPEETAKRLAQNYRRIKVFLNLPSESRLLVSKVYEVLACGTFLLTPGLSKDAAANMDQFVDGTHLIYYKPSNLPYVAQLIRELAADDAKRAQIAEAGRREVREKHSLQGRMERVLQQLVTKSV